MAAAGKGMERLHCPWAYSISRPPDKSVEQKIIFLVSQPKHMLWVLKRKGYVTEEMSLSILVVLPPLV